MGQFDSKYFKFIDESGGLSEKLENKKYWND